MKQNNLVDGLIADGLSLACAESVSGGLFSAKLTSVSGSSQAFVGSVVSYQNLAKSKLLNIDAEFINYYGVISKEVAVAMATSIQNKLDCDIAVSITGNAGPNCLDKLPIGKIYVGIVIKNDIEVMELQLSGSRNEIRNEVVDITIDKLNKMLGYL